MGTLTLGLKDDMWRLEAKGVESDVKKAGAGGGTGQSNIMFVRGETQSKAVNEMVSAENPDEIDISDEDEGDDEEPAEADAEVSLVCSQLPAHSHVSCQFGYTLLRCIVAIAPLFQIHTSPS